MLDVKELRVIGGRGGDGAISFAHGSGHGGGPDGGDGGNGGDVSLVAEEGRWDLGYLYRRFRVEAGDGVAGSRSTSRGRNGKSVTLGVPLGTVVWLVADDGTLQKWGEVLRPADRLVIARGGMGGEGNKAFASSTNRVPVLAEAGEPGDDRLVRLEVRLLADVAIVGAPNAGKSSLLAAVTNAKPKVGAYPFSTLEPRAGVVTVGNRRLVLLDVPGMLEGAHEGRGLGLEFLRHSRRAKALLQMIDGTAEDLGAEFERVDKELRLYDDEVASKPRIVVINKADLEGVRERWEEQWPRLRRRVPNGLGKLVSVEMGEGLADLLRDLAGLVPPPQFEEERLGGEGVPEKEGRTNGNNEVSVGRDGDAFVVQCLRAERILARVNIDDWRVRVQFHGELERLGVLRELERAGVAPGDTVRIGSRELEWD